MTYTVYYTSADAAGDNAPWSVYVEEYASVDAAEPIDGTTRKVSTHPSEASADVLANRLQIRARLEYLRGELRAERISMGELADLQGLAEHIEPGDVELLEAAGVPEFPEEEGVEVYRCKANATHLSHIQDSADFYTEGAGVLDGTEVQVQVFRDAKGTLVIQVDTVKDERTRVNLNDGSIFDQHTGTGQDFGDDAHGTTHDEGEAN